MSDRPRHHEIDVHTGRPLDHGHDAVETLTEDELEEELTIAAYAPGRWRLQRFQELLDERRRRLLPA